MKSWYQSASIIFVLQHVYSDCGRRTACYFLMTWLAIEFNDKNEFKGATWFFFFFLGKKRRKTNKTVCPLHQLLLKNLSNQKQGWTIGHLASSSALMIRGKTQAELLKPASFRTSDHQSSMLINTSRWKSPRAVALVGRRRNKITWKEKLLQHAANGRNTDERAVSRRA